MSDIEVEAVDAIDGEEEDDDLSRGDGLSRTADVPVPDGVDAPEYVLYGGKGGVGKTTCAAATALASARDGTPTLVVSTDPAHSLADVLETHVPTEPGRLTDEFPLYGVEIDPESADSPFAGMGDMGVDMGMDTGFGDVGGSTDGNQTGPGGAGPFGGAEQLFDADDGIPGMGMDPGSMPGADEAAAMQLLLEYLDDPRFERVVVDTAPTGHTLRLLQLPEVLDSMVGRMLTLRQKLSGMLGTMPGPFGDADAGQGLDELEALSDRIERLRSALRDPDRTEFRVVMVPEQLSVIESERLLRRLADFGIPSGTLVMNQVTEDLANVTDVEADWFVTPDLEDCAFCQRRWQSQQEALRRAQEVFRGRDVKRVPLFAQEVSGREMLAVVAACLD